MGVLALTFGGCLGLLFVVAVFRQGYFGRSGHVITRSDHPIQYWLYVVLALLITAVFFAAAALQWVFGSPPTGKHQ